MSKDWIEKTLTTLGFNGKEVQLYIFLLSNGPQKAKDIAKGLKIKKHQLYYILRKMKNKGVIYASFDYPVYFSAVFLERVLDTLINNRLEQKKSLEENKNKLISIWHSIKKKNSEN